MATKQFMHVCIAVPDLEKAVDFYTNVLGMKTDFITDNDKADGILLGLGQEEIHLRATYVLPQSADPATATVINLVEYLDPQLNMVKQPNANDLGLTRLAFMVDNIDDVMQKVEAYPGAEIVSGRRDLVIKDENKGVTYVSKWCGIRDLNGVLIMLYEPDAAQN